jgi:hypothetical protein
MTTVTLEAPSVAFVVYVIVRTLQTRPGCVA